ncbi:hypothetical protein [Photorhabdus cinerea]|uniref:hypothetical protein n=1 Tax=Photorhabdus cinerea TaxID=471575 RepID=UPI001F609B94|nr:hypothetical protein [Photorhabdus cinerea]
MATRCGMGACQGKICSAILHDIKHWAHPLISHYRLLVLKCWQRKSHFKKDTKQDTEKLGTGACDENGHLINLS